MRAYLLAGLMALLALAGCIDGSDGGTEGEVLSDPTWTDERMELPENFMPHGDGHDHTDQAQHQFLWNYEVASFDPLMANEANQAGLHVVNRQGDYLFGGVYGSHDGSADGGLVIWDISDPESPVEVGRYSIPGTVGGDRSLGVTVDGDFAVLGAEKIDCFGHVNPNAAVIAYLFDTSDKTAPTLIDTVTTTSQSRGTIDNPDPVVNGVHSVEIHRIGGEDYAVLFGDVYRIERDPQVEGQDVPAHLEYVGQIPVGHDIYIRDTPWGDVWGLTATETTFLLQDLNDITAPESIGTWHLEESDDPRAGEGLAYYYHTADVTFFDDQTIVVQASEDAGDHVSPFWILDITDLDDIRHLGTWSNPFDVPATSSAIFSQHNQRFHDDGIMTLTHYHGGLVQFDFRHPDFRGDPAIIAYAATDPHPAPLVGDATYHPLEYYCGLSAADEPRQPEALMYLDLAIGDDGIIYVADLTSGLVTFRPTADHPVYGSLWA